MRRALIVRALGLTCLVGMLAGCDPEMNSQPKYNEYKPGPLFRNGRVLQAPVPGTVAREDAARRRDTTQRPSLTPSLLARGRERYDIYCSPCHGRTGRGDGMVVARGMPHPPTYHQKRLREAPDQHFFDVITNGYGAMYPYRSRVEPRDRWAIVAYIRVLQLSQNASLDDVPAEERAKLQEAQQ